MIIVSFFIIVFIKPGLTQHKLLLFQQEPKAMRVVDLSNSNTMVLDYVNELIKKLRTKGYFEASIDSINITKDSSFVYLQKGSKYNIRTKLRTTSQEFPTGDSLVFENFQSLNKKIEMMLETYHNNGYPFASASSEVKNISDSCIDLQIDIIPGNLIKMDTIIIDQKKSIVKTSFIMTYLKIEKNSVFNHQKIKSIRKKIRQLEFIKLTSSPLLVFENNKAILTLNIEKAASNTFDGIIGFTTQDENNLKLTGKAMIDMNNPLGYGEKVYLNWTAPGSESQSLDIETNIPYILQTAFGTDLTFRLYKQDSSYVNLSFKSGISYRFNYHQSASFFLKLQSSNVVKQNINYNSSYTLPYQTTGLGVAYHYKNFDQPVFPRKGWLLEAEFTGGTKRFIENNSVSADIYDTLKIRNSTSELFLKAEYYVNPFNRSVFLLRSKSKYLNDEQMADNQLYRLGGNNNLKGFDEDIFHVSAYSLLHFEYRFLLEQRSFISLFQNIAIIQKSSKNLSYPFGFGAGIAFQTNGGIFKLYYALGKQKKQPILFRNSKVHFGFTSRF